MKRINVLLVFCVTITTLFSCKDDTSDELAGNTWTLTPEGVATETYRTGTITFNTQIYQTVEAKSIDNTSDAASGLNSTLTLFFATAGPPPTGTYSVTSLNRLSGKPDAVAIYLKNLHDPSTGLNVTSWYSQEDSGQAVSVTFANGKISATFKDVPVAQTGAGPQIGTVSASISQ